MSALHFISRTTIALGVATVGLVLAQSAYAAPQPKPACGTTGAIDVTAIAPAQYSYTLGDVGSQAFSLTVSSPAVSINGNCNSALPSVFGNGNGANTQLLPYAVSIGAIAENGIAVDASTEAALRAALSAFAAAPFQLTSPGSGSQTVSFSFTNSLAVPAGEYDLTVEVKPETGVGVGAASKTFTIQVEVPQIQDSLAPVVNIVAPTNGSTMKLNDTLPVNFTAVDPPEGGAGTGVTAVRAAITSCAGAYNYNLTSSLYVAPGLPVAADTTVTSTTSVAPWLAVGEFTLRAEADDGASHTGSASATFSVGTNVAPLPPISVPNRQFNAGSTLPIKFVITDGAGELLPPMDGLVVRVTTPSGSVEERMAGSGAANVRWELDEYGNATQYITNYVIPVTGTYRVDILVSDVCSTPALQGGFNFVGATKGGKQ